MRLWRHPGKSSVSTWVEAAYNGLEEINRRISTLVTSTNSQGMNRERREQFQAASFRQVKANNGRTDMGKYSDILMDHFTSPRNSGPMEHPDVVGHAGTPGRGPFMILYIRLAKDVVAESRFQTYGCGATIASGSALTELIKSRSVAECLRLSAEELIGTLDGVPADKLHGPALAIGALRDALKNYQDEAQIVPR